MDKTQAKLTMYQELNRQAEVFRGCAHLDCEEIPAPLLHIDEWSLSFSDSAPLEEIKVTLMFFGRWVDVLASPCPSMVNADRVPEMVRFVNRLNGYVGWRNSNGRLYVNEDELNVGYCARISYDYLELLPREAVCLGVMIPLSCVSDAAESLYHVGRGEMSAEDGFQCELNKWREE